MPIMAHQPGRICSVLTTDYINHFGALAMLLEILPDFPEGMDDLLEWKPKSYEEHVRAITFTDPEVLLANYKALDGTVRDSFDSTVAEANLYGQKLIRMLNDPDLPDRMRRDLCSLGHATITAFIQRMNGIIAGADSSIVAPLPYDLQNHIDGLFAQPQ